MRQFSRFLLVGFFNTFLGYAVIFSCMYLTELSPEFSNILGYSIGLLVSYLLNKHYTFRSSLNWHRELIRFLLVFCIAYAANFAILIALIRLMGVHEAIGQICAGVVYVVVSYLLNKIYVFRKSEFGLGKY